MMRAYLLVFLRGLLMVSLVAGNTVSVSGGHYAASGVGGLLISALWWSTSRCTGRSELRWGGLVYGVGAGCGTVLGMTVMHWWFG